MRAWVFEETGVEYGRQFGSGYPAGKNMWPLGLNTSVSPYWTLKSKSCLSMAPMSPFLSCGACKRRSLLQYLVRGFKMTHLRILFSSSNFSLICSGLTPHISQLTPRPEKAAFQSLPFVCHYFYPRLSCIGCNALSFADVRATLAP